MNNHKVGQKKEEKKDTHLLDCPKVHWEEDVLSVVGHDIRRDWGLKYFSLLTFSQEKVKVHNNMT